MVVIVIQGSRPCLIMYTMYILRHHISLKITIVIGDLNYNILPISVLTHTYLEYMLNTQTAFISLIS